jgi:hypothetical protein
MMTYRQFEVPEYHDFIDLLGVGPDLIEGGEAQAIQFQCDDEIMVVTFDVPGQSIHCRWTKNARLLLEVEREGAIQLRLRSQVPSAFIDVDFETDDMRGQLEVQVLPAFAIRDGLLFR